MSEARQAAGVWTPDGVARIIAEAERAGVTHFRLDVASAGLTLDFTRGGSGAAGGAPPAALSATAPAESDTLTITAPVLGTFYRRRSPEEPPLVQEGQAVQAGELIGLIEVMKTYHEITAPSDGIIASILAEDGHYVEYGQGLATMRPHQ